MDINILGYRVNLEIIILIGVLYLILMGHLFGGCCHIKRGTGTAGKEGFYGRAPFASSITGSPMPFNASTGTPPSTWGTPEFRGIELERWGVPTMAVVPGQPISHDIQSVLDRPSTLSSTLQEGNLDIFARTKFTPEACATTGSSYSTSMGCAALSPSDYNLLVTRGGNNSSPYSEY